jgi:hypothetical protein
MTSPAYLLSLPERVIRAALGLSAGLLREIGEVVVPRAMRRGQLYKSLVDTTLRYMIEQVGGATGVYPTEVPQTRAFLARRGVGHMIELLGIAAFRISPVWVFAALADVSGIGRRLIPEIAEALKEEGLLEKETQFETVDQLLDGLEKTSSRLARTINVPPLDVAGLRAEWSEMRLRARELKPLDSPSVKYINEQWEELKHEAARQGRSVFATSSVMAISAVRSLPARARWFSSSTRVGAVRAGRFFYATILADYSHTLGEVREAGYASYARRQLSPYLRASVDQLQRPERSITERIIGKIHRK